MDRVTGDISYRKEKRVILLLSICPYICIDFTNELHFLFYFLIPYIYSLPIYTSFHRKQKELGLFRIENVRI